MLQSGRRKIQLVRKGGELTLAGRYYEAKTDETVNTWKPGIVLEGLKEYAYKVTGGKVLVRYRDNAGTLRVTKDGRSYFETHATEFLVQIPFVMWHKDQLKEKSFKWRRANKGYMLLTDFKLHNSPELINVQVGPPPLLNHLAEDDDEK